MKKNQYLFQVVVVSILLCFAFSQKAYAYLDPGTGSYLLQLLAAFAIGGLFALKVFWGKVKTFFGKLFSRGKRGEKKNRKVDG